MTDVALWVTKQHRELDDIIYVGDVAELAAVRETAAGVEIGAAVSLTRRDGRARSRLARAARSVAALRVGAHPQ